MFGTPKSGEFWTQEVKPLFKKAGNVIKNLVKK